MRKPRIIKRTGQAAAAFIDAIGRDGIEQGFGFGAMQEVLRFNDLLTRARRDGLPNGVSFSAFLFDLAVGEITAARPNGAAIVHRQPKPGR